MSGKPTPEAMALGSSVNDFDGRVFEARYGWAAVFEK